ncbi:MAG: PadR family transcriptional regulator [Kouleothrix sp.]|jgi:DNA-binding PadR family transcriptional regulator|nr:PadR family transcriptional regulator [Kouleothrix sp.]
MFRKHHGRRKHGPWGQPHERPESEHEHFEEQFEHRHHGHHRPGGSPPEFGWRHYFFGRPERPPHRGGPFGGPFGGDPFDQDGGGRRRHRRGDIKFALLELLAEQPRHGYDLIKELEQRYGGFYRPSPGSVYPTLQLLEDEGHLTSATVDGKRVYTITESGRGLLAERQRHAGPEGRGPHHGFRGRGEGQDLEALKQSGMALTASVMQAARHGTPKQVESVMRLLDSTRREIYAILSQADTEQPE